MEKIKWKAQTRITLPKHRKNFDLAEIRVKKSGLIIKKFIGFHEKKTEKMLKKMELRKNIQNEEISKLVDFKDYGDSKYTFYYECLPYFEIYKNEIGIKKILGKILRIFSDLKKNDYLPITIHPEFLMADLRLDLEKNIFNGFKLFFFGEEINESERYKKEIDYKINQYFDEENLENIKKGEIPENLEKREKCLIFCLGIIFMSFLIDSKKFTLIDDNDDFCKERYDLILDSVKQFELKEKSNLIDILVNMINLDAKKRPTLKECFEVLE